MACYGHLLSDVMLPYMDARSLARAMSSSSAMRDAAPVLRILSPIFNYLHSMKSAKLPARVMLRTEGFCTAIHTTGRVLFVWDRKRDGLWRVTCSSVEQLEDVVACDRRLHGWHYQVAVGGGDGPDGPYRAQLMGRLQQLGPLCEVVPEAVL